MSQSPASHLSADVLIVGGGLVGGTMACAFAQSGISCIVVDHEDPATAVTEEFDGRCSAIALAPQRVLDAVGLWPLMAPGCQPILEIRVSDGHSPLFLHYDHKALGEAPFGWLAENRLMRKAIFHRIPELPLCTHLAPAKVATLERDPSGVRALLADGRTVSARLAVAADGRGSPTRTGAGIGITFSDYHQTGIVCTVAHERPHRGIAQEHFLPAGPFAILPITGNRSSIVWTEKSHLAPAILRADEATFMAELRERFGEFLGEIHVVGPRFGYPLSIQFADRYTATRLALIGDAAHGMHPIAGQGMNMGLRDVAALAEVVVEAKRLGLDPGSAQVLERYTRWRRFDNMLMLGLTDALNRLFSNDLGPLRLARDLGLAAVNRMPPLKKVFMRHAMGLVGELPRLMRGEAL